MHHSRSRPTLLVVDDEAEVLRSVYDLFRIDYRVVGRQDGREALEYLRSSPDEVHVILCDQRMPGLTGVEVLSQAQVIRPETTRLLFTAYADIRAVIDAVNRGRIFRYIAKPWDPEELDAMVRQAVEHHNLMVEKNRLVAELQETNAKLTEANRLKGAFLEVASHELNTPVTVVLGLTDLWNLSQAPAASPTEREWVQRIGTAARRLARTVDRMFKLIHNEEFGQTLDLEPVEIGPLISRAIDDLRPYLESRSQRVTLEVEPDLGPVPADRSKLTDVIINLIANAIKFTPDGGTIRIAARSDPKSSADLLVVIQDEGVGVHPTEQKYLFEPFFTGFDTLHHSSGDYQFCKRGIGLGLCLVKSFVELHGGKVEVLSTPSRGSTFSFSLPRNRPPHGGRPAKSNGHEEVPVATLTTIARPPLVPTSPPACRITTGG